MSEHLVFPNGTMAEDGQWSLDLAIGGYSKNGQRVNAPAAIKPGDTVFLRGGVYRPNSDNGFRQFIASLGDLPITFRNYNGERATLEVGTHYAGWAMEGANIRLWGLEIRCAGAPRATNEKGSANPLSYGFNALAERGAIINCIIHDTAQGISGYDKAVNFEAHGNICYYNGWRGPDRPHGHGIYMQNAVGNKWIENNFVFDNCSMGLQIYGSGGANITGMILRRNASANSGSVGDAEFKYNFILGGGQLNIGNIVEENAFFFDPNADYGYLNFGQYTRSQQNIFRGNWIVGGYTALAVEGAKLFTVTDNWIYTRPSSGRLITLGQFPGDTLVGSIWDRNKYYGKNIFVRGEYNGEGTIHGGFVPFAEWRQNTGFDAASSFDPNAPTGEWIRVTKNKYEEKRASIVIYNWDLLDAVAVDVSEILKPGDKYNIWDAHDFFGDANEGFPAASGTYAGGVIAFPMKGLKKAPSIGIGTPPHTAPLFGMFVIMPPGPAIPIPQPPPGPSPDPIPTPIPGGVMNINDRIFINNLGALTKVRSEPSAPDNTTGVIGTAAHNSFGVIKGGPQAAQTFVFWDVLLDSGLRGWIAEGYLRPSTEPLPGGTPVPVPTPSAHKTTLHWMPSVSAGITGYRVSRSIVQGGPYTHMVETTLSSIIDPTVEAGKKYYYVVQAVSPGGISVNSNEASGTIPNDGAPVPDPVPVPGVPLPPTNLTVTVE